MKQTGGSRHETGGEPVPDAQPLPRPAPTADGALAQLYLQHAVDVARWASRLGGPEVDAHDVVQEVFLVASRRLPRFDGTAKPTTWLYRTTEKVVQTWRRKRWWRHLLHREQDAVRERTMTGGPTPVEALERKRAVATLYRVLDTMPERYRNVLVLFELEELSGDQIAELMAARPATVRVWLHRARAMFSERALADKEGRR